MNPYLVQAIGFVGVALFIISYQIKSNRALFFCQMMGCLVFCVQFFLITKYSPPQLVGSPCTLTYDLIVRSWGGALSEGIAIASILVSIWRFGWNNLAEETS